MKVRMMEENMAKERERYEREISILREQLEKRIDDITDIARQTKVKTSHTHTNNNIMISTTSLDLHDIPTLKSVLLQHLDIDVLAQGQKGVARMLKNHFLTDDQGNKKYKCTDANRGNFEFVDPNGHVEKDPKGAKLREALVQSDIKEVAFNRGEEWWKKEDGSTDMLRFDSLNENVKEVADIGKDDTKFRNELSVLMS